MYIKEKKTRFRSFTFERNIITYYRVGTSITFRVIRNVVVAGFNKRHLSNRTAVISEAMFAARTIYIVCIAFLLAACEYRPSYEENDFLNITYSTVRNQITGSSFKYHNLPFL